MTLEKYISEAISHGLRHDTKPVLGCTLEDILDWLELNGVQGTKYGVKKSIEVKKGEIGYLAGPWTNDKEEQWVCVGNYWGQRVTINPNISVPSKWYDDRDKMLNGWELSFNEGIKLIERMIANSYRKLDYKEVTVSEAISHGHNYGEKPRLGCYLDEVLDWLELKGIIGHRNDKQKSLYRARRSLPKVERGRLMYIVGPWSEKPEDQWVIVCNHWGQNLSLNPNIDQPSKWRDSLSDSGSTAEINLSFDNAVEIVDVMVEHPNRYIEVDDIMTALIGESRITEAVSHGNRHTYHDDMTLDGICEWLRSLGFKKAGQTMSFNKEYDIYVEENGEYILVRALFKMNGKNYQLDTKLDLTAVGDVKSMELYVVKKSNTYLIGAAYDKNMAAYDEIMDQVDSIKK